MLRKLLPLSISAIVVLSAFLLVKGEEKKPRSPLSEEIKTGASGNKYTFIYQNTAKIDFVISRPSAKDTNVLLCIAAAFTTLDSFKVDGLYSCKGVVGNKKKINQRLGGGAYISQGTCRIAPTNAKSIEQSLGFMVSLKEQHISFFQQIQMITDGKPASFVDTKLFQRRGIVIFKNGMTAIAESEKAITLKAFANDLAAMDVKDLLYTDMGAWDEGWVRLNDGSMRVMGLDRSQTARQSNWVIFRK